MRWRGEPLPDQLSVNNKKKHEKGYVLSYRYRKHLEAIKLKDTFLTHFKMSKSTCKKKEKEIARKPSFSSFYLYSHCFTNIFLFLKS